MSVLANSNVIGSGTSGVDTGDIGHSLRFRGRPATPYLNKTFGSPTTQNGWAFSCWVKFSELPNGSNYRPLLAAGTVAGGTWPGETLFCYPDGTLAYYAASVSGTHNVAKRSSQVLRDPTAWVHIFVRKTAAANSGLTFVRMWVNNIEVTSWSNNAYTGTQASVPDYVNVNATAHRLGMNFSGEYLDGYISRVCFVDNGSSLLPTDFAYLNTEINEWVSKSQSAVKAVVDAGGTNSFMLDFDDATSLTTLGYDKSSKGNNWTLNNFSLTAGTTYDHMLDVPGNSFATLNPLGAILNRSLLALSEGNIKASGTSALDRYAESTLRFGTTPCVAEATLTSYTSGNPSFGTVDDTGAYGMAYFSGGEIYANGGFTTPGTTYTAGDTIRLEVNPVTRAVEIFKNGTSVRQLTLTGTPTVFQAYSSNVATWVVNHGQAPLHASATYHSAAGGYFRDAPTTGFLALCQANLATPAILNPTTGFVSVLATEDNIDSNLATARSGWSAYVDIKKNRAAAETWAWQFSHDSSNEYAIANASKTYQAKRAMSGANNWVGYSIRIGSLYGTAAGSVSHTNGVATTVTHNLGTAEQMVFLFPRAAGSVVPVFHPVLTAGSLLDLCGNAGQAASTAITSVGSSSFQIGSGQATGTYDYLVLSEKDGLANVFSWAGNSSADGPYTDVEEKPGFAMFKNISGTNQWMSYDTKRETTNVMQTILIPNSTNAEATNYHIDFLSRGIKPRAGAGFAMNDTGSTYAGISYADVAGKYSLAR